MIKVTAGIDGMACSMCEAHVKEAIYKKIPEAKKLSASHTKNVAEFTLEEDVPQAAVEQRLHEALDPTGYRVLTVEVGEAPAEKKGLFARFR